MAFGYFESLFQLRDTDKVAKELVRIKSFNQLLDAVGQDENLYDIFVDATEDLLLQVSNAIQNGTQDETFLLEAFNSEYNSNAIITHFRVTFKSPLILLCRILTAILSLVGDQCLHEIEPHSL